MNRSPASIGKLFLAGLAFTAMACSTSEEETTMVNPLPALEGRSALAQVPKPLVSLQMPNGNTIEFHSLGEGALILETGKAGTAPVMTSQGSPVAEAYDAAPYEEKLSAVWKILAPTRALPKSLADIETKVRNQPRMSMLPKNPVLPEVFGLPALEQGGLPLAKQAALEGCNNGCCDYNWLLTLRPCQRFWEFNWVKFNYLWTTANSTSIDAYSGLVCAAVGASNWKINIDGSGGNWSIPEGNYKTWTWYKGVWDQNMTSAVNSKASQRLHTYCGNVSY